METAPCPRTGQVIEATSGNTGIGLAMVWAIFGMPFAAIGLMADMSPLAALLIGILAGLPITIVLGGLVGVFYENLYTLFYFELVEPGSVAPEAVAPSRGKR